MLRTIIVDDSDLVRDRLVDLLSSMSDVVVIGLEGDAHYARTAIQLEKPDLVILDLRLIGGSGIDILREIRRDQPDIKVIIFTGYPYPQYRQQCLKEGAFAFLDKSNGYEEIKSTMERLREQSLREVSRNAT